MKLKDVKDYLNDVVETENPSGTTYYGAELDEDDVEVARERIDKVIRMHEDAVGNGEHQMRPAAPKQAP